jgi:hypothetical protein
VPRLVAADLVCRGRVARVAVEGEETYLIGSEPTVFRRVRATVEVERAYKGSSAPEVEVELLQLDLPSGLARLEEGEVAVLFLERRDGRYALADPVTAKIRVEGVDEATRRALAEAREGSDADAARVAREILADLERG